MFWLLSHKHYRILSLLILTEIMSMSSLINKLTYTSFFCYVLYDYQKKKKCNSIHFIRHVCNKNQQSMLFVFVILFLP